MTSFNDLPLRPAARSALAALGLTTPTAIQSAALPPLFRGQDVIGQARTGSGKTIAFALPIVERVDAALRDVQALVLVPTRELAAQVATVVQELAAGQPLQTLLLVGGLSAGPQQAALRRGVQVVVGTPGRVLDHIRQGNLLLQRLRLLVLDEADEMLDRGFGPDVERIIAATPPGRQTALFSATHPDWLDRVAARYLRSPVLVRVDSESQPVENVAHAVYDVPQGDKLPVLRALLDGRPAGVTLVFGRTKHGVKKLARQLAALGYPVGALQGNMSQNARDRVMAEFRSGQTPILLATNVAARGLDVEHVAQVINYELPESADLLTHRVGRTGRMGRAGEAITLLAPDDELAWRKLERELKRRPLRRPWQGGHVHARIAPAAPEQDASSKVTTPALRRSAQPAAALPAQPRPSPLASLSIAPTPTASAPGTAAPRRRRRRRPSAQRSA